MQVNVIDGCNLNVFDQSLYPVQNPINNSYIEQQFNRFSGVVSDIGQQFIQTTREMYDRFNDSEAIRLARAALRMSKNVFMVDEISFLEHIDAIRGAQHLMQRYVMAEPTIRESFHRQLVDGYSNTYFDAQPQDIKEDHIDYMRVMDGVMVFDEENIYTKHYIYTDIHDDAKQEEPLTAFEKACILDTWDIVKLALLADKDPTDIYLK